MGFFGNLVDALWKPRLVDPVEGTAQVVSASMPPYHNRGGGMCVMNLVISIPGQPAVAVEKASIVRLSRWPMPGTTLPIIAERSDPRKYVIQWDQLASSFERAAQQAAQIADRINASGPGAAPADGGAGGIPFGTMVRMPASVTINGQPATADAIAAFEAMTGMDLNGDGQVGGRGTASPGAKAARNDSTAGADARLRDLQSLRDGGLISESEYQAKRAEIMAGL